MDTERAVEYQKEVNAPQEGPSSHDMTANSAASRAASSSDSEEYSSINDEKSTELDNGSPTSTRDGQYGDDHVNRILSRRQTSRGSEGAEDMAQIAKLMSRMFGKERKSVSDEEKTRHVGVIWKDLIVKGIGLGAALQPTNADIFLAVPRLIKGFLTRGRKGIGAGHQPLRTILDDFTVCLPVSL
jgi:ATP-binding cassette subfamily G (WHITE) protein 2 (SNQ2)